MFDFNATGQLSFEDVVILMRSVTVGVCKLARVDARAYIFLPPKICPNACVRAKYGGCNWCLGLQRFC